MKRYISIIAGLLLASYSLSAQSYEGVAVFESAEMREEGDSLKVSFDVHVKRNAALRHAAIHITPAVMAADTTVELPDLMLQGANKYKSYNRSYRQLGKKKREAFVHPSTTIRVGESTDTMIKYTGMLPYETWMEDARMLIRQEIIDYRDRRNLFAFVINDKVQLEPRIPYKVEPVAVYVLPERKMKSRRKQGSAYLDFKVGSSVIIPDFRRNPEELAKIREAFREVQENPDVRIVGLFIDGYASPEGSYSSNDKLSRERANALKDYIVANYNVNLPTERVKVGWTAEDWDGLTLLLQESSLPAKDRIIAIIESVGDPDAREARIRALDRGVPYRTILKDMYPSLRRVEYQIDYTVKDFTVEEARVRVGDSPELLSQNELYQVAESYGRGSDEYYHILKEVIPKYFPDDPTANINAAAAMIETGEYATAKRLLQRYSESPQAWNNLGAALMAEDDLDEAEKQLRKAQSAGISESAANLAELAKKREDNQRMEKYKNR